MPKYKIGYSYGYPGTDHEDIIETDSLESAEKWAWEEAIERVSSWAKEITDEDSE